jgi:murein DD-endopeptidase MepM/ murein hydrolase activator NlpD
MKALLLLLCGAALGALAMLLLGPCTAAWIGAGRECPPPAPIASEAPATDASAPMPGTTAPAPAVPSDVGQSSTADTQAVTPPAPPTSAPAPAPATANVEAAAPTGSAADDAAPGSVLPPLPIAPPAPLPVGLMIPVEGVGAGALRDNYTEARADRVHEAIDIAAPRGTPVRAADSGRIVKLFESKPGGLTLYQFDPTETYAYYYAHLDGYAPGIEEGDQIARGDVIGYVGSTGNASPEAPHLHFAVFVLGPEKRWWKGTPANPYPLLVPPAPPTEDR